jgi:hypothetical protein
MFSVLYFPIWWYTTGLRKRYQGFWNSVKNWSRYLALKILITNLFRPMFGQYNWQGRIISFVMRVIQLLISLIIFSIGLIFIIAGLILWMILPITAVAGILGLIKLF